MKKIFEAESNASQDSRYREHLDRNWQNGNTAFNKLFSDISYCKAALANIAELTNRVSQLEYYVSDLNNSIGILQSALSATNARVAKNASDINNLRIDFEQYATKVDKRFEEQNKRFDEQDKRLKKLEDAVFRAIYVNDTMQDIPDTPLSSHYINDTNAVDDNGLIINDDSYTLPYDIN